MRLLITGSRDWDNIQVITDTMVVLKRIYGTDVLLVSGACPAGADRMCEDYAIHLGWLVERHPADWDRYGKSAGPIRNQEMVDLGADVCLAFIKNNSRGATMTANLAMDAGIETKIYRE